MLIQKLIKNSFIKEKCILNLLHKIYRRQGWGVERMIYEHSSSLSEPHIAIDGLVVYKTPADYAQKVHQICIP